VGEAAADEGQKNEPAEAVELEIRVAEKLNESDWVEGASPKSTSQLYSRSGTPYLDKLSPKSRPRSRKDQET